MKNTFLKTRASLTLYLVVSIMMLLPAIAAAQEAPEYVGAKVTSGRTVSLLLLVIGVISVVIAYRSKKQTDDDRQRRGVIIAGMLGLITVVVSISRIIATTGFGTGGGRAGAIAALFMGVIGISLSISTFIKTKKHR